MTTEQRALLDVTQEDRELAAAIFPSHAAAILQGECDNGSCVQTIARHRIRALSPTPDAVERVARDLRPLIFEAESIGNIPAFRDRVARRNALLKDLATAAINAMTPEMKR